VIDAGTLRRFLKHPSGMFGTALLVLVVLVALFAGIYAPQGPWPIIGRPLQWPGQIPAALLGTDHLGRDLLVDVVYGTRASLFVGVAVAVFSIVLGTVIGAMAGYYGRWVDDALMRFTDAVQTVPSFLAAMVIVGVIGQSLVTVICAIAIVSWPMVARLVRADFLRLKSQDFILACRIMGMGDMQIIFTQILPNCLSPIIVAASVIVASAIIVEAGLSFLGLGDPNVISWGSIIGGGRAALRTAWHITLIPAVAVVITVLSLNLIGDALNDVLNPHLKHR